MAHLSLRHSCCHDAGTDMHLRIVKAKSGKTVRRYAQLVESYRRDDGLPVHRVLASLGQLSDRGIANFRLALDASRKARSVVLPEAPKWRARVLANLAYLDVAVALEMWRSWELSELLHRLIPERDVAVRPAEVICALTIQRCVAPGSKLQAQRWFPWTALPELLGLPPAHFHSVSASTSGAWAQQDLNLRLPPCEGWTANRDHWR